MSHKASSTPYISRKFVAAGLTAATTIVVTRPIFPVVAYAATNQYDWVKQVDQDLKGGSYTSVASSADGSHLIIGSRDGGEGYNVASPLYVSDNYGATWQNVTDAADHRMRDNWTGVDVTDNGQTMVAVSDSGLNLNDLSSKDGKIVISHNGGDTWQNITPSGIAQWKAVAISGDGGKIVAVANDDLGHIYTSTNGGSTWQTSNVSHVNQWRSASISDNGNTILVGGENTSDLTSLVYLSDNGGDTWTDVSPDGGNLVFATRTAMSSSGDKIAVSTFGWNGSSEYDAVYESTDDGTHWSDITPTDPAVNQWNALAMSGNGNVLSVLDGNDKMYLSNDDGANWSEEDPGQADNDSDSWRAIDFSAGGSRVVAVSDVYAYVGHDSTLDAPTLNLTNAEDHQSVTLTTPDGTTITCHTPVKESSLSAQDGAYSYPLGLIDFCFSGADASNGITLVFVTDLKPNQVTVRKYNSETKQYATVTGATITETTLGGHHALRVAYNIIDNGPFDTNPALGEVADPVGLAVLGAAPNTGLPTQSTIVPITALLAGVAIAVSLASNSFCRKLQRGNTARKLQ